jgi:hypothetical protein
MYCNLQSKCTVICRVNVLGHCHFIGHKGNSVFQVLPLAVSNIGIMMNVLGHLQCAYCRRFSISRSHCPSAASIQTLGLSSDAPPCERRTGRLPSRPSTALLVWNPSPTSHGATSELSIWAPRTLRERSTRFRRRFASAETAGKCGKTTARYSRFNLPHFKLPPGTHISILNLQGTHVYMFIS